MSQIAEALGKEEDLMFYQEKAMKVKDAFNHLLFDKIRGVYVDGIGSDHSSLHANMFPLAFGLVPRTHQTSVIDHIKSRGMACSVYGTQYLLEGLFMNGESGYALELITDTIGDRNWWNMIESGSTMTMEAWDKCYKPNLDWNHAWGTAPANIITRHLWGIRPAEPGFAMATIQPQLSGLTQSEIRVPTIVGTINAGYEQIDEVESYIIELPVGMTGTFVVPEESQQIMLNGSIVDSPNLQLELISGYNRIQFIHTPSIK